MPLVGAHFCAFSGDCLIDTISGFVQSHFILKGVSTNDVEMIFVLKAYNNASRLIDFAGERFELDSDINILGGQLIIKNDRETSIEVINARLREDLGAARR